jgi:uncharacterized protein (DUF58 family)
VHLAERGYFLVALTVLLAISSTWSSDPRTAWSWALPLALLLAGLAFEAWRRPHERVAARVAFARRPLLGREVQAAVEFTHGASRRLRMQYVCTLPSAFAVDDRLREIVLQSAAPTADQWALQPVRLGPARFTALPARILGRFGLAWWTSDVELAQSCAVAPDVLGAAARSIAGSASGDTPRRSVGAGGELFQLRPYVPGDPLARVDWKASARAGELIAREMADDQHLEVVVVLDAGRMSRVRAGDLDRLALYANVAARFAEHATRAGDRVGLVAYADRPLTAVPPARGSLGVRRIRDALERLESTRGESRPLSVASALKPMLRHHSLVVWLCDFADPDVAAELLRVVQALRAKHFVVVAGIEPRAVHALAARTAHTWRDPAIAIAASERAMAIAAQGARLRERGVLVVTAAEGDLEHAVIRAYDRERRRRRL